MDEFPITKIPPEILEKYFSNFPSPPTELFIRGTFPDEAHLVFLTIVGARHNSIYGKEVCEYLIKGLRGYPIVIVSGLALGIDAIAHQTALDAGMLTISFPGSGLGENVLYPNNNRDLAREILEHGGCLLSEYPEYYSSKDWMFPRRNRLMAGISRATLIIEATHKSGSRITTKLATDFNRDVLAVPGSILDKLSEAPNELIRMGATPITSSQDILEALGFAITETPPVDLFSQCTDQESDILKLLGSPKSRGDIIRASNLPIIQINGLLSQMEIKGLIKESGGMIQRI